MHVRNGFVTNSSSTSFLFYGIAVDKYDLGLDQDDFEYLQERMEEQPQPGVVFRFPHDMSQIVVYAEGSYAYLGEYGIVDLPLGEIPPVLRSIMPGWNGAIHNACDIWGIPVKTPKWKIALSIER